MNTYPAGETARFTFQFYEENSETVLENQDSVKFYFIDVANNKIVYESDTLTNTSTGTYVIYYTMPFSYPSSRNEYKYKVIGLKSGVQSVQSASLNVE